MTDDTHSNPVYTPQLRPGNIIYRYRVKEFYREGSFKEVHVVEPVQELIIGTAEPTTYPLVLKLFKKMEHLTSQATRENLSLLERATGLEEIFEDPRIPKFFSEVKALKMAQRGGGHPNIARIVDAGMLPPEEDKVRLYIVEEYIEGKTLTELMAEAPEDGDGLRQMPSDTVTDIFYQLAGGVEFLHEECKMAHCDIKGENIIVTPDGRPVLTDFGNARLVTSEDYLQRGSILYRSPEELLLTNKPAGKASDIWAMGLLLYQALSGKYPFETNPPDWSGKKGEELEQLTAELKMNIALDNIAPISRYNPGVPDNLKAIIKGALKRHPDQRWRIRRIVEALEDQRSLLEEQAKAGRPLT